MILGKSFAGCCRYVMLKPGAYVLDASDVRHDKVAHTIVDFELVRQLRPSVKNVVLHCSISFAYEDKGKLTDDLMVSISKRFLKKLNLDKHQTICVKHIDASHSHFHLVINRVGFDGKLASDRFIKNRAAKACDELEIEFGMTVARGHGKGNARNSSVPRERETKALIQSEVEKCFAGGVKSMEHLADLLKRKNIEMRVQMTKNGKVNGVSFSMGGVAFKGSSVDKRFSYKRLAKSTEIHLPMNSKRFVNVTQVLFTTLNFHLWLARFTQKVDWCRQRE